MMNPQQAVSPYQLTV